jgi:hypothetical protein
MGIHRSFKLTRSGVQDEARSVSLVLPLVQQFVILGMASLILDGGVMLQIFGYAALAYWIGVGIILQRRRTSLTGVDKSVIRLGFLLLCAISLVLTEFIWHLRGV